MIYRRNKKGIFCRYAAVSLSFAHYNLTILLFSFFHHFWAFLNQIQIQLSKIRSNYITKLIISYFKYSFFLDNYFVCRATFHLLNKGRGGSRIQELSYLYMYQNVTQTTLDLIPSISIRMLNKNMQQTVIQIYIIWTFEMRFPMLQYIASRLSVQHNTV